MFLIQKTAVFQYLVKTLNVLRSRGYDSAGICALTNKFNVIKTLETDLDKIEDVVIAKEYKDVLPTYEEVEKLKEG